jgi:hypothetical protein
MNRKSIYTTGQVGNLTYEELDMLTKTFAYLRGPENPIIPTGQVGNLTYEDLDKTPSVRADP